MRQSRVVLPGFLFLVVALSILGFRELRTRSQLQLETDVRAHTDPVSEGLFRRMASSRLAEGLLKVPKRRTCDGNSKHTIQFWVLYHNCEGLTAARDLARITSRGVDVCPMQVIQKLQCVDQGVEVKPPPGVQNLDAAIPFLADATWQEALAENGANIAIGLGHTGCKEKESKLQWIGSSSWKAMLPQPTLSGLLPAPMALLRATHFVF